jgi:gluconolactonase
MLKLLLGGLLFLGVIMAPPTNPAHDLLAETSVHKLGGGMKFLEGPVWSDADGGFLLFSDIPADELKRWTAATGITPFRKPSHNSNGNTRDLVGRLISCETGATARRITRTEADGSITILCDSFEGHKLNATNDVVVKSDGTIWFTDPTYGMPEGAQEIPGQYVFRLDPGSGKVAAVATDFVQPNGLCFSPDEKRLYIADSGKPHHIRVFDVTADGKLANGRFFCTISPGVPDGIRCDARGNVWSTAGDGIYIFSPEGKLIEKILVPETPANLCFGGADGKTLFITARTSLYCIHTAVAGAVGPAVDR